MIDDDGAMGHALALARRGQGRVWPNPPVGCVLVADGRVIARARTGDGGRPHAEASALTIAGDRARGATAYVTLEPCAHEGETPACARLLAEAGIARAVIGCADPDPRTSGRGVAMLKAASVAVETGCREAEARDAARGFLVRQALGRPAVTLKLAQSLDGRIATAAGESRWITGARARARVHAMRARHDAVMIGAGTARADDPELTVREGGARRQPVRVVLSRHLDLPRRSRLLATIREAPLWLLHAEGADAASAWEDLGARCIAVPVEDGQIAPEAALAALGQAGLTRVLCEGGGMLAASLLGAGLVDDLALFSAGRVLGAEGVPSVGALGIGGLAEAPSLRLSGVERIGEDTLSLWRADGDVTDGRG